MRLTTILPVLSLITAAICSTETPTSNVVTKLDDLTEMASDTDDTAKAITATNRFRTVPRVISDFREMISKTRDSGETSARTKNPLHARPKDIGSDSDSDSGFGEGYGYSFNDPTEVLRRRIRKMRLPAESEYTDAEQQEICDSYESFSKTYIHLLKTMIGKHGLLSGTPFEAVQATAIRKEQDAFDNMSFAIIEDVPSCSSEVNENLKLVDEASDDALNVYYESATYMSLLVALLGRGKVALLG